jgi:threonine/homoserine/homoserine lactone efflux protein
VVGLSAIVTSSALAFAVVKLAGATYLIYVGIRTIREGGFNATTVPRLESRSLSRVFRDGFIVNLLNPKTAVFFLAFVPQFVDPNAGSATVQLLVLGALFVILGSLSDGAYALAGGGLGRWLQKRPGVAHRQHLVTGTTYIGLGVAAALSGGGD